jgi:hypothetical protein
MPPYSVVKTTGSRDFDNIRIQMARPEFIATVTELISSPDYKAKSANEQQSSIKSAMNKVLSNFKQDARDVFISTYGESAVNTLYEKAPDKAAQEDAFVRLFKRKPSSLAEKFSIIEGEYKDVGVVGKAKGGLVSQMDKLLTNSRQ